MLAPSINIYDFPTKANLTTKNTKMVIAGLQTMLIGLSRWKGWTVVATLVALDGRETTKVVTTFHQNQVDRLLSSLIFPFPLRALCVLGGRGFIKDCNY
jgi:hypothetical protein